MLAKTPNVKDRLTPRKSQSKGAEFAFLASDFIFSKRVATNAFPLT